MPDAPRRDSPGSESIYLKEKKEDQRSLPHAGPPIRTRAGVLNASARELRSSGGDRADRRAALHARGPRACAPLQTGRCGLVGPPSGRADTRPPPGGSCLFSVLRESARGASAALPLSPPHPPRSPPPSGLPPSPLPPPPPAPRPALPSSPAAVPAEQEKRGKERKGAVKRKAESTWPRPGTRGKRWVGRGSRARRLRKREVEPRTPLAGARPCSRVPYSPDRGPSVWTCSLARS